MNDKSKKIFLPESDIHIKLIPGVVFFEHMYPEFIDWDAYSNTILKLESLDVN